jgi:PadR family transcriptional regulator PadR
MIAVVPKRGWLVVGPGKPGELPRMMAMHRLAIGVFDRAAPHDALTETAFFVAAGTIIGTSTFGASGGGIALRQVDENAWNFPTRARHSPASVEDAVLDLVGRGEGRWNWKDIATRMDGSTLPMDFNLVTTLRARAERGLVQSYADERGNERWRLASGQPSAQRIHHVGARLQRLAVQLPASGEWQDTGLQPDVLATRPLLVGCTTKLLWKRSRSPAHRSRRSSSFGTSPTRRTRRAIARSSSSRIPARRR